MLRLLKIPIIVIVAIVVTSLGIDAADTLQGSRDTLLAGVIKMGAEVARCPEGMVFIDSAEGEFCIDAYERSVGASCAVSAPTSIPDSARNLETAACFSVSMPKTMPWSNVTFHQAKELCAKSGLRLPTHTEWYEAALGTQAAQCHINGTNVTPGGERDTCKSMYGAYDMVGNVWEWIDASVESGRYQERTVPVEGYVAGADAAGVATQTGENPNDAFGKDYFWSDTNGSYLMMRGGFYGSGEDAGLYSVHARVDSVFAGTAVGFRCVK